MFRKAFLLLVVGTCVASAIHVRVQQSWEHDKAGSDNDGCNSKNMQKKTPIACNKKGFACVDPALVIRKLCKKCREAGEMSAKEDWICQNNVDLVRQNEEKGGTNVKGVKVQCIKDDVQYRAYKDQVHDSSCAFPAVTRKGAVQLSLATDLICPCAAQLFHTCKTKGTQTLSCMLGETKRCPKLCRETKTRLSETMTSSFMEASSGNEMKGRASLLVDARGKTVRNESASLLSLDHAMTGKCSQ